jgi:hypothetical protein
LTINQYGFARHFLKYFQDSVGQNVGQIGGYGIGFAEDVGPTNELDELILMP